MEDNKVKKIYSKASDVVKDNDKVMSLLKEAKSKLDRISQNEEERTTFVSQLKIMLRMLKSHFNGDYTAFSTSTILSIVFGLLYFITPIDLIPDFIPALGLTDDITLIYFIFRNLAEDIENFRDWESSRK